MPRITSRNELIEYCLRRLGFPVVEINVDMDQIEDRVDDAFKFYTEYHFDATERVYYVHEITAADITNQYIEVPDSLLYITKMIGTDSLYGLDMPLGDPKLTFDNSVINPLAGHAGYATSSVNDHAGSGQSFGLTDYYLTMNNIELIKQILGGGGDIPIRFNRHANRVYLDDNWEANIKEGYKIMLEGYAALDPDVFNDVYNDRWLQRYLTALIKQQWGMNLKKFEGIALPGGVTLDGRALYQEATDEIEKLEEEMLEKYTLPPLPEMG